MSLVYTIARRYLFGKKSTNAITIIIWISIVGMAIGTAALVLILSVFNGFERILIDLLSAYNPDIRVTATKGQYLDLDDITIKRLNETAGIDVYSKVLEEVAMFEYGGSQEVGYIKGVDSNYIHATEINKTIKRGEFIIKNELTNMAVSGIGIYNKLSINSSDIFTPINMYIPIKAKSALSAPFNTGIVYPSGVFSFGGEEDGQYIITNLEYVQTVAGKFDKVSALEIKLTPGTNELTVRKKLSELFDNKVEIRNKLEQDAAFLKIMNIERWVSYLIAVLTLGIISFNLIGSLWMIVLDKKKDIAILKSMGFESSDVRSVFKGIGVLVGFIGLMLGLIISGVMYFLQKEYNLIAVPDGFMMEAYPIEMRWMDLLLVFVTVIGIAYLASLLPAYRAGKVSAFVRQE